MEASQKLDRQPNGDPPAFTWICCLNTEIVGEPSELVYSETIMEVMLQ